MDIKIHNLESRNRTTCLVVIYHKLVYFQVFWTLFESLELLMPVNIDEIIQKLPLGGVADNFFCEFKKNDPDFQLVVLSLQLVA